MLTGAPNLFHYKGQGPLPRPIKVAYAREGARLYDGHQPGQVLTTLKRAKIRGVESFSMVCSEKELGISEEHEGVIILDDDAPTGMPLVDYMGDAVFEINDPAQHDPRCLRVGGGARAGGSHRAARCASRRKSRLREGPAVAGQGCHPDPELRAEPALRPGPDPGGDALPQPLLGAAPAAPGRHAPDQCHRGCHQLRDARIRPTAARLRLRCAAGRAPAASRPPSSPAPPGQANA